MKKTQIFGLNVSVGKYEDFISKFIVLAKARASSYHVFTNSHMVYEAKKSEQFFDVIANAENICPDGMPLTYSVRWLRKEPTDRVAGNDVISSLIELSYIEGLKIFFYGSTIEVLDKIKFKIEKKYKGQLNANYFSPPFKELDESELRSHANMINDFEANIVLVGLGCPKQERWMSKMKGIVNAPMFGVGGAFLLYAGVDTRAPKLMRDLGIEWLYRLALEPRRLFMRYLVTNLYFCKLFLRELFKKKNK